MRILVINSGSSSIKYKLFAMPQEKLLVSGSLEHIGEEGSPVPDHYSGLKSILKTFNHVDAVGHRVVHGAESFKRPHIIDQAVLKMVRQCSVIAPLHNPANIAGVLACKKLLPGIKQVAVFDTAFHQTLPEYAFHYGLPYEYYKTMGIRKYGFHGTSHEYVAHEAARRLKKPLARLKLITCHLGNGCSITAINKGVSIDTSMGFTPLEGLLMGTRCGDIDPALVTYIMRKKKIGFEAIDEILNKKSGLKGISGVSNDMRALDKAAGSGNKRAQLAINMFVYRIKKYIGAYAVIMGGLDALVFTAGIGEHQQAIRSQVCKGLFTFCKRQPKVLVIPTNEELMIARKTFSLIKNHKR
ncbi:MAG: acetate kinase [Candidatus Omnitrophica bacterium]|nr:acetate kinase [Candidatus Omnitrophota bacterium]